MSDYALARPDDLPTVVEICAAAFATTHEDVERWLAMAGHEHLRVVRAGERVVASLIEIPMGHFWLGRSVPTIGIAGVGCLLEERGRGHTRELMDGAVRSAHERGVATSTLFPATQTLYRRSGYERAGLARKVSIPLSSLAKRARPEGLTTVRLTEPEQHAQAQSLYGRVAAGQHGHLDRGPYVDQRVRARHGKETRGFGFSFDGALEGYLYLRQDHNDPSRMNHDVWLTDVCAATPRAHHAVVRFLFELRSTAENVGFYTPAYSTLLSSLDEAFYEESRFAEWMIRVCHLGAAIEGRGFPAHVAAGVTLALRDPLIEAHDGTFRLEVRGGRGTIERTGQRPEATLGIGGFAMLYSGFASATAMRRLGLLDAEDEATSALDAIFASPMPSLVDMF